ncbi:hypothetical protein F5Y10DRAFT_265464 [Nemania abortiva]|nr:hypothetical protein F5Y10DRAFT_265464 [Nemania abortiva]
MAPSLTLLAMPTEIIIKVYTHTSAFRDVFALSAACHRLHAIWLENVTSIYRAVGPSGIGFEFLKLARQLLADQGGASTDSATLSAHDVRRMARNARKASKAADNFDPRLAPIRHSLWARPEVGKRLQRLHADLSTTEYLRFIRSYYRVCSLLELGLSNWRDRYKSFTLRQLYRTTEMTYLRDFIGEEQGRLLKRKIQYPPSICVPELRAKLNRELERFKSEETIRIHGRESSPLPLYYPYQVHGRRGVSMFIMILDDFEEQFYRRVVGRLNPLNTPRPYDEYMREEVWGDSSDEETYEQKYGAVDDDDDDDSFHYQ